MGVVFVRPGSLQQEFPVDTCVQTELLIEQSLGWGGGQKWILNKIGVDRHLSWGMSLAAMSAARRPPPTPNRISCKKAYKCGFEYTIFLVGMPSSLCVSHGLKVVLP